MNESTKLDLNDEELEQYLKNSEKFKWDKQNTNVTFRHDGGVENVAWAYLILTQAFLAFTFYFTVACVVYAVLASAGVIGYGIRAVDQAQNAASTAALTYFRGSNPTP